MDAMFCGAASFNSVIPMWDATKVTDMDAMFCGAAAFNGVISK